MSENERGKDEGGLRRVALVLPHFFSRSPFFPSQLPRAWNRLTNETLPSTYIIKGLKPFLLKENWLVTHLIRGPSNASICFFFRVLAQCLLSLLYVYSKNQVMLNLYNYGILGHLLISKATQLKINHQIFPFQSYKGSFDNEVKDQMASGQVIQTTRAYPGLQCKK